MIVRNDVMNQVKLVMFERTMMPESTMETVNGKKEFVKTGKEVEMTTYTFRDGFGDKLVMLSKENGYRDLEGELVDITLDVKYNDFTKKTQTKLVGVQKAKQLSTNA